MLEKGSMGSELVKTQLFPRTIQEAHGLKPEDGMAVRKHLPSCDAHAARPGVQ